MKKKIIMALVLASISVVNINSTIINASEMLFGDANNNNMIDKNDAEEIMKKVLNKDYKTAIDLSNPENAFMLLDVDCDNDITASDASLILKKIMDADYVFPAESVATISLENINAKKGEIIELPINILPSSNGSIDIKGYIIEFDYDKNVLEPIVQGKDILNDDLYAISSLNDGIFVAGITDSDNNSKNKLVAGWANSEAAKINEKTNLATLKFKVNSTLQINSTDISINVLAFADDENIINNNRVNTTKCEISVIAN